MVCATNIANDTADHFFEVLDMIANEEAQVRRQENDRVLDIVKSRKKLEHKAKCEDVELFAKMVNAHNQAPVSTIKIEPEAVPKTRTLKAKVELFKCVTCSIALVAGALFGGFNHEGIGFGLCVAGTIIGLSAGVGGCEDD